MRKILILLPLFVGAAPAVAQPVPRPPRELIDPSTAQRLSHAMQALSQALLNVRIGKVKAALDGREVSPQDRNLTVRDLARRDDPNFDRHLQQQVANVEPMMERSMNALNEALPAMMQGLAQAQKSLERAVANLPDPTYPKR